MAINLASLLKQLGRDGSQGQNSSFFYLVDSADIDFRVEGFIGATGIIGDPSGSSTLVSTFNTKYVVLNEAGLTAAGIDAFRQAGIQSGDIIEKRSFSWGIHLDVSKSKTEEGALVYNKYDNKFYYRTPTAWVEIGAGTLTGDSQAIIVTGTEITARLASTTVTGVASFDPSYFSVDANGEVSLTAAYQITGDTVVPGIAIGIEENGNTKTINNLGVTGVVVGGITLTGNVSLTSGDLISITTNAETNTITIAASQGIQGTQGLQGLQGLQGTQGLQGVQGLQGRQGLQGVQGLQGLQGLQGTQGLQGVQGLQGLQGTQGLQGVQGLQGRQGLQGIQGLQGLQGTIGPIGAVGDYVVSVNGMTGVVSLTGIGFYGLTGTTSQKIPFLPDVGETGDRLLVATGPTNDPFRQYIKFGNAWVQTGIVGIGQGPQGIQGTAGDRGPTGATGPTGTFPLSGYEEDTSITHDAPSTLEGTGKGRKILVLNDDGTLTFDYIISYDVFNPSDFNFGIIGTSTSGISTSRRISVSNYAVGTEITATYRNGPPTTGHIRTGTQGHAISGFPVGYSTNSGSPFPMTSATITGNPSSGSVVLRIEATGTDYSGSTRYVGPTNVTTIYFRNDILFGVTSASYLTGGAGSNGMNRPGEVKYHQGLSADISTETLVSFNKNVNTTTTETGLGQNDNFRLYVAYPARLHNESWGFQGFRLRSSTDPIGGMVLQGYNTDSGLSTVEYTNQEGFKENYKIWRSNEQFTAEGISSLYFQIAFL
jgi:hypothetical protein